MERDERVEGTKDLSELALRHDVQLQHGLIVHLVAQVKTTHTPSVYAWLKKDPRKWRQFSGDVCEVPS